MIEFMSLGSVYVGGPMVADATREKVIRKAAIPAGPRARLVYALHVGGLLELRNQPFRKALDGADLVYADGAAVILLARAAGAKQIERAPTTDIGMPIVQGLSENLSRPVRVALLGGPPGLAVRASSKFRDAGAEVVLTLDGYFTDDEPVLESLREAAPDLVVVGLGMPREAIWTFGNRSKLPAAVILTCGGWFGFLAGDEKRAPQLLHSAGLEWTYRLSQQFRRLIGRYSRGALKVVSLLPGQIRYRKQHPH